MVGKGKLYQFLNPVGLQFSGDTLPLATHPIILNGKEIRFSISGDPGTLPLEKRSSSDYRSVRWHVKKPYMLAPVLLKEEMKTADDKVQGVAW